MPTLSSGLPHRSALTIALVLLGSLLAGATGPVPDTPQQTQGQTPVFRGGVTLVPVDVRVVDRDNKPVTNLTAADFTILENGVPQQIRHFAIQALTPGVAEPDARPRPREFGPVVTLAPQNHRVFLIVLGRGRLQEPSKGVDALLRFVRTRLLPQDLVAVMAWNRATDFSNDHAAVADIVERFRTRHEMIEMLLQQQFSGLAALYGSAAVTPGVQVRIDDVFKGPLTRTVAPTPVTDADRVNQDTRRLAGLLQQREIGAVTLSAVETDLADSMGFTFDAFVAENRLAMQDLGNLYTGIEYLRLIDGEKHLIFVTEQGIMLPRMEDDRSVARVASDARVALHTIQTGGVMPFTVGTPSSALLSRSFQLGTLRTLSEMTGGQASISNYADDALTRILASTEFGYQLGYTPTNTNFDGQPRTIEVRVNRRNVRLHYRRGYFGRIDSAYDRRTYLAFTRIMSAYWYDPDIRDIRVSFRTRDERDETGRHLVIEGTIDAERIRVDASTGERKLALNMGVFWMDRDRDVMGEEWQPVDITLTGDMHERLLKSGITFSMRVPVRVPPIWGKVVVYDYVGDRLGSQLRRLR